MSLTTSDPDRQPWQSVLQAQIRRGYESDNPLPAALFYLALLTVAELVTVLVAPQLGVVLHLGSLFLLLLHCALVWERPLHRLLLTLAFVPLIRVISMSLPLIGFPLVSWYAITSVPLFVAAVVVMRLLGLGRRGWGLGAGAGGLLALPLQLLVGASGIALGYVEYLILRPEPLVETFTWQAVLLPALVLLVSTGYLEELIFRGLMQQTAVEQLGRGRGIIYVALFFAVLHIGYLSVADVLFVLAVGLAFGLIVQLTGSLLGVTLAHGLTNITLFLVMPFVIGTAEMPRQPLAAAPLAIAEGIAAPGSRAPAATAPTETATASRPAAKPTVLLATARPAGGLATSAPAALPTETPLPAATVTGTASPGISPVTAAAALRTGTPPAEGTLARHVLRPGQTLSYLAGYYQTTEEAIRRENDLADGARPEVGRSLWIPVEAASPLSPTGRAYIVQGGDTLSRIAREQGTTVEALLQLNWLPNPALILPGQLLWLPAEGSGDQALPPD